MSTTEVKPTPAPDSLESPPSPQAALVPVITVDPTGTSPTGSDFDPQTTPAKGTVPLHSQITLKSKVTNLTAKVYTYNSSGLLLNAFLPGQSPYDAPPSGMTYTLLVSGAITLSLQAPSSAQAAGDLTDPKNGTINVGGQVVIGSH